MGFWVLISLPHLFHSRVTSEQNLLGRKIERGREGGKRETGFWWELIIEILSLLQWPPCSGQGFVRRINDHWEGLKFRNFGQIGVPIRALISGGDGSVLANQANQKIRS
ncbi:hypothetical protein LOK49_Contig11G00034 [Camellia lanceoleosa]|nr:hypothetical protein LOK49_Contig11G00034 [Camellia lanceoleosa]